jgi:hypothetical protein
MTKLALRGPVVSTAGPRGAGASRLRWAVTAVLLAACVLFSVAIVTGRQRSADLAADLGAGPAVAVAAVTRTAAPPVALQVPALGLDTPLGGLRTDRTGALQVDPDPSRAGWYVDGPAPGDLGPAVLAGHLDSRAGPGVFAGLDRLRPGARITVERADGTTADFVVREVTTYAKRDFPTGRVYGGSGAATLRIITCGGAFDPATGRYRSNTVVFADLVGTAG